MSALSWQSLSMSYGPRTALSLGAFSLGGGQLVALLGPNGSGKSSLMKALIGAIPAQMDGLHLNGQPADTLTRNQRAQSLAYLSQSRTGPALATVRDVVALGRAPFRGRDAEGRVDQALSKLDLLDFSERKFGMLSGGEQARVLLARTLAVGAKVILADEPTAALDPHYALSLMDALKAEATAGALVLVSLHRLDLAERYADRALVLNGGKIAANGPVTEALTTDILRDVFRVEKQDGQLVATG